MSNYFFWPSNLKFKLEEIGWDCDILDKFSICSILIIELSFNAELSCSSCLIPQSFYVHRYPFFDPQEGELSSWEPPKTKNHSVLPIHVTTSCAHTPDIIFSLPFKTIKTKLNKKFVLSRKIYNFKVT